MELKKKVIWGELQTIDGAGKNVLEKHTIKGGGIQTRRTQKKRRDSKKKKKKKSE